MKSTFSRRELFKAFLAAPFMAAVGRPIKKPIKGRFQAWFKYYARSTWISQNSPRMIPILFIRKP